MWPYQVTSSKHGQKCSQNVWLNNDSATEMFLVDFESIGWYFSLLVEKTSNPNFNKIGDRKTCSINCRESIDFVNFRQNWSTLLIEKFMMWKIIVPKKFAPTHEQNWHFGVEWALSDELRNKFEQRLDFFCLKCCPSTILLASGTKRNMFLSLQSHLKDYRLSQSINIHRCEFTCISWVEQ